MKKFVIIFFLTNISNLKYLEAAMFLIFANYRSSHRRSYIKKSFLKILKNLHVNNCDDLGPQIYTLFFIRASKFCLRLAVLNFFLFLKLKFSQFVLNSPTGPCNATKKNVRLSIIITHYFIPFILFLLSSAHRQALGGVLQKIGSTSVLKPITKYLRRSSIFH